KQLNKLIEVVKLVDLTDGSHIEREMMLVKVRTSSEKREHILQIVDIFRGRVADVNQSIFTIELTGTSDKLDSFLENLSEAKIIEVVRSGVMGIARGEKSLSI
ncbi:MAG TPA: acetolactate synthase small subunit, partial [Gammaproteobacteria bacterium]|nr:acetolactate synthase small subunit [Gammaproteobacteria bacterium]